MAISAKGLDYIKKFEGYRQNAYKCPAGVWTVGYGTTQIEHKPVKEGDSVSIEEAVKLLVYDVKKFEVIINALQVKGIHQNEFDCLVSFVYNVGINNFNSSTLRKRLIAGDDIWLAICQELPKWCYANKKALKGLMSRRITECSMVFE